MFPGDRIRLFVCFHGLTLVLFATTEQKTVFMAFILFCLRLHQVNIAVASGALVVNEEDMEGVS